MAEVLDAQIAESSPALPADSPSEDQLESVTTESFTPEQREAWIKEGKVPSSKKAADSTPAGEPPASPAKIADDKSGTEARIHELLKDRKEAREEAKSAKAELEKLNARLAALERGEKSAPPAAEQPKAETGTEKRLSMGEFIQKNPSATYEDYEKYRDEYDDAQIEKRVSKAFEKREQDSKAAAQKQAVVDTIQERFDRVSKSMPDLHEVLSNPELRAKLTPSMDGFLFEVDKDLKITHYLGTNLEEAERISKLTPIGQLRALGKLEDQLYPAPSKEASPAPKKLSAAPPPPAHVAGTASAAQDEAAAALAAGDFRRFMELENARDIAKAGKR